MRLIIAIWRGVRWLFVPIIKFLSENSGAVTALATLVIGGLTFWYVIYSKEQSKAMKESNGISQSALNISQRAVVTIGNKDGVVADFVIPKDPTQNAEIVMYFQNSGHLPATFSWGTMAGFLGEGSKKSSGINYTHPFHGLSYRSRDKKTGSIGTSGESSIIAGDSVFRATLGSISQKDLAVLPKNDPSLAIIGMYEYCDEFSGNSEKRNFGLRYRNNAPTGSLSFDLAMDTLMGVLPPPKATSTTEYLPPCETLAERERNQKNTQ
jgi:hypothetical protein